MHSRRVKLLIIAEIHVKIRKTKIFLQSSFRLSLKLLTPCREVHKWVHNGNPF